MPTQILAEEGVIDDVMSLLITYADASSVQSDGLTLLSVLCEDGT